MGAVDETEAARLIGGDADAEGFIRESVMLDGDGIATDTSAEWHAAWQAEAAYWLPMSSVLPARKYE